MHASGVIHLAVYSNAISKYEWWDFILCSSPYLECSDWYLAWQEYAYQCSSHFCELWWYTALQFPNLCLSCAAMSSSSRDTLRGFLNGNNTVEELGMTAISSHTLFSFATSLRCNSHQIGAASLREAVQSFTSRKEQRLNLHRTLGSRRLNTRRSIYMTTEEWSKRRQAINTSVLYQ
jgi:hypothetical protein